MSDQYPRNLAPEDRAAWRAGELVIGTDGHIVPPKGESPIEQSLYPEGEEAC